MTIAKIKIDSAVICDDIRREMSNKILLIGVWPLELAVADYPSEISMVIHCEGAVLESGSINPRLYIKDEINSVLYDSDKSQKLDEGRFIKGRFSLDFNVYFSATRAADISFIVTMGDEEYVAAERRIDTLENFRLRRQEELKRMGISDDVGS